MLTVGSFAMDAYEPGQVRKKAAVSRIFHVPRGGLTELTVKVPLGSQLSITGARSTYCAESNTLPIAIRDWEVFICVFLLIFVQIGRKIKSLGELYLT